jgi:hypothetical protein
MLNRFGVKVICPYCGLENKLRHEAGDRIAPLFTYCDLEQGGCDGLIVYNFSIHTTTEVFKVLKHDAEPALPGIHLEEREEEKI